MENVKRTLNSITDHRFSDDQKDYLLTILKLLRSPIGACVSTKYVYGNAPGNFHEKYVGKQAETACRSAEEILNETYKLGLEDKKEVLAAFKADINIVVEAAKNDKPETFNLW